MLYLVFAMIVLTVIYIVDEVTSNVNTSMQPYALFDLFHITSRDVTSVAYKNAINTVAPWSVASNLFLIVTPFYKSLSDRFGRKLFLMINTIGMGVGMLIVMTSQSVVQYILGMLFMMFFTPNDMQVLYIMETAPKEKRATLSFIAKGIALISVSAIGLLSKLFLREDVPSGMRASVMGTISVMIGAGMFVGQALFIVLQNFVSMDLLFLCICVPFMAVSLLLLMTKVKETKHVDLDSVTADTFR